MLKMFTGLDNFTYIIYVYIYMIDYTDIHSKAPAPN